MTEQTWIDPRVDRAEWGPGAWDGEPDKVQWVDPYTQLICLAKRQPTSGNWCGYVGVAQGHPWHGKGYDDIEAEVHGGLTFADKCQEGPPAETICHVPAPGEPDGLWWFGFDCHHAWDLAPGFNVIMRNYGHADMIDRDQTYRDLDYVRSECTGLALQIKAALPT